MADSDDQPNINISNSEFDAMDYVQIIGTGLLILVIGIAVISILALIAFMLFPGAPYFLQ